MFLNFLRGGSYIPASEADPLPVTIPAGSGGEVVGRSATAITTFTRPNNTTAYTAGDVIGSDTSANIELANAGPAGSLMQIQSASVTINRTAVPTGMTTLKLHLFDAAPGAIADNAAFAVAAADRTKYCGVLSLPAVAAVGGGFVFSFLDYTGRNIRLQTTSLYANLVTDAGVTPAAQTEFRIRLHLVEVGA